jgi:hypothetical protein
MRRAEKGESAFYSGKQNAPGKEKKRRIGEAPQPLHCPVYRIGANRAIGKKS